MRIREVKNFYQKNYTANIRAWDKGYLFPKPTLLLLFYNSSIQLDTFLVLQKTGHWTFCFKQVTYYHKDIKYPAVLFTTAPNYSKSLELTSTIILPCIQQHLYLWFKVIFHAFQMCGIVFSNSVVPKLCCTLELPRGAFNMLMHRLHTKVIKSEYLGVSEVQASVLF